MAPPLKPGHNVFGVNSSGRVLSLSREEGTWRELQYMGVEFKRASAASNVVWAIGGDHQVYVYVYGLEVAIRVKECVYENQRWNPVNGFSDQLLPTDRPQWSSVCGLKETTREGVQLPSMAWAWDEEWHIDQMLGGSHLPMGGWTYAVDFPAEYHPKKGFTSCVRRRRWVRHRRFVAVDAWTAVPGLEGEVEPLIDCSVGGDGESDDGELRVWAVTAGGRLVARQGVTKICPEGRGWLPVPTPLGKEVAQVSVAPSGLVWAVTWDGGALVRLGVDRMEPVGLTWVELEAPRPQEPLALVSVGQSAVWGVTRSGNVWLRQGVRTDGGSQQLAKGVRWVAMVGKASLISLAGGDGVMAIDDKGDVMARTGVSAQDLSGKTWMAVARGEGGRRRRASSCSYGSYGSYGGGSANVGSFQGKVSEEVSEEEEVFHKSDNEEKDTELRQQIGEGAQRVCDKAVEEAGRRMTGMVVGSVARATVGRLPLVGGVVAGAVTSAVCQEVQEQTKKKMQDEEFSSSFYKEGEDKNDMDRHKMSKSKDIGDTDKGLEEEICKPKVEFSGEVDESVYMSTMGTLEPQVDTKNRHESKDAKESVLHQSLVPVVDWEEQYNREQSVEERWVWLTASACNLSSLPTSWIPEERSSVSGSGVEEAPWRTTILAELASNRRVVEEVGSGYQPAIESSSWTRKAAVRVNLGGARARWEQMILELEVCGGGEGRVDFGTLSLFGQRTSSKEHFSLAEFTAVSVCSERKEAQLALHTSDRSLQPLLMRFSTEAEMRAWHGELLDGMNAVHGTTSRPAPSSLFSVTVRGEVMVWDPTAATKAGEEQCKVEGAAYTQQLDLADKSVPVVERLTNGFGPGSTLYLELRLADSCNMFSINLSCGRAGATDADISLHFNPRLGSNERIVVNSFENGVWGEEESLPLVLMLGQGQAVRAFQPGQAIQLLIKAEQAKYEIYVNGVKFAAFLYRVRPENVTHVRVGGDVEVVSGSYSSRSIIIPPKHMYWRNLGGGHLLQVESCPGGVVWGLGYDSSAWSYTGGWGGGGQKDSSSSDVQEMHDSKYFYIYENQRWNPLTGFSTTGLPTDRPMWSDRSGRHAASKEGVRLPGEGWSWSGDWCVDYHTPGGVDREGWQFATDFPASYHPAKAATDFVRRRRWARKCALSTSGPWTPLGSTRLLDISLQGGTGGIPFRCWAVATNGEAVHRVGVSADCPGGVAWTHVTSDVLFQGVSVGQGGGVWLVCSEGRAFLRLGVCESNPSGHDWLQLPPPEKGERFRAVEAGEAGVWAMDQDGGLWQRRGVGQHCPEGTMWAYVCEGVRSVSSGPTGLWAVLEEGGGVLARRGGMTPSCPGGQDWEPALGGGWKQVTARGATC